MSNPRFDGPFYRLIQTREVYRSASRVRRRIQRYIRVCLKDNPETIALHNRLRELDRQASCGLLSGDEAKTLMRPIYDQLLRHPAGDAR